jgi:saccharopine dehydrogenase (NAD+, L-lysine-forming)
MVSEERRMSKVLIIGAGGVGRVVAHKCAQRTDIFSAITLASRTRSKCDAIAKEIDNTEIYTAQVDADNVSELTALLKQEQPRLVINVALPYQDLTIMDACLAAGVDYLDTANYEPLDTAKFEYKWQWDYQKRFQEKNLMALLGSGFDPGMTNVYTALATTVSLLRRISIPKSTFVKSLRLVAIGSMASGLKQRRWLPVASLISRKVSVR